MYKDRSWDYQIYDILLKRVDIETGDCVDEKVYSYEGECSGISDDINCSDDIVTIGKRSAIRLIEMLQKQTGETE